MYVCVCMYFEVLMITTDIHCHSHRSFVSRWFVVRLLFVCILAEMHCSVRLVLADILICCVTVFRVIVIGRNLPSNVISLARMMVIKVSPLMLSL